jgi:hypothetical protein
MRDVTQRVSRACVLGGQQRGESSMQLYHAGLRSRTCDTRPAVIGGAEAAPLNPRSAESASRAQDVGSATIRKRPDAPLFLLSRRRNSGPMCLASPSSDQSRRPVAPQLRELSRRDDREKHPDHRVGDQPRDRRSRARAGDERPYDEPQEHQRRVTPDAPGERSADARVRDVGRALVAF